MLNAMFVVWRESFEAVLIVGILFAFLRRQKDPSKPLRYMWGGVGFGVVLSLLMAYGISAAQNELQGLALEYFQIAMLFVAAAFMTHMCIWMKKHARHLKKNLEKDLGDVVSASKLIGVMTLSALAVAREGMEIVIFLFGMGVEAAAKDQMLSLVSYGLIGFGLTLITAIFFYSGLKFISQKMFFRITTIFLMLTASTLVLTGTRKLIQNEVITPIVDQVWDTSFLLDERSTIGSYIASPFGYESTPALMTVLVYVLFWVIFAIFYSDSISARIAGLIPAKKPNEEALERA